MGSLLFTAAVVAVAAPVAVQAQGMPKFSTAASTINQLMSDPAAKAVLEKHMPQIGQAQAMIGDQTLKSLQSMAPDRVTDQMLAAIDADLAMIK